MHLLQVPRVENRTNSPVKYILQGVGEVIDE